MDGWVEVGCVAVWYLPHQERRSLKQEHLISVQDGCKVTETGLQLVDVGNKEVNNVRPRLRGRGRGWDGEGERVGWGEGERKEKIIISNHQ